MSWRRPARRAARALRRAALGHGVLRHRFARRGLILLYHRVTDVRPDPWLMCVTPRHFAEHLEVLREHGRTVKLARLVRALMDGAPLSGSVAVTFDDGYADNIESARPLLDRYDVPAAVFVTSGFVGGGTETWWDELERLVLGPGTLPEIVVLRVSGGEHRWELGAAARYGEGDAARHRHWSVWGGEPTPRHSLYRSLHALLLPLPDAEQRRVLEQLARLAGAGSRGRATHRTLSSDELARLASTALVEVGAHSVTHPVLGALPPAAQRAEIEGSRARLEELLGAPVTGFAYPYGAPSTYTAETVALVREAGFACACTNVAEVVSPAADCYQLPRVQVQDWDGDEFARRLIGWLGGG